MSDYSDRQNKVECVVGKPVHIWPEERLFVYGLVKAVKPKTIVEIGVSAGILGVCICRALKENGEGIYIGVDDWSTKHGGKAKSSDIPRNNILEDGTPEKFFKLVSSDSQAFLNKQPDKKYDIIIIDANHDYEHANKDTIEAMRVAKYLTLTHDTENLEEVREACRDLGYKGVWVKSSRGYWMYNVEED